MESTEIKKELSTVALQIMTGNLNNEFKYVLAT